jgi:hypothetical protein
MIVRVVCNYRCDEGHAWSVTTQESGMELPSKLFCPHGHAPVTCSVEYPVEDVQILISPAARIVDSAKGQRVLDGRFHLSLLDRAGATVVTSRDHFDWDAVVKLAAFFRVKSLEQAQSWWLKRNL